MKNRSIFLMFAISATSIGLTACSNNAQTGAVIGSLVGAGIGKSTGNHRDKRAVIGGVLGGLVGASIGEEQDRRNAAARGYATTSQYSNSNGNTHTHGNRTHTHSGGVGSHSHNNGPVNNGTVQQVQTTNTEVIYVERPYYPYPVSTSIILGTGYYGYPRRHYRNRHNYRHNNRVRHNRHRNRYR